MRSENQKQADARYYKKIMDEGRLVKFQAWVNKEQAQELTAYIQAQGISKPEFLRRALAALKSQE